MDVIRFWDTDALFSPMHQTMDVIRFWTWMLSFPRIWMNMMIKNSAKKTLILIARFWARKIETSKTSKKSRNSEGQVL